MEIYRLLIEHDGMLYRGNARGVPKEYWSDHDRAWKPCSHVDNDKSVDWGMIITPDEAETLKAEDRKAPANAALGGARGHFQ